MTREERVEEKKMASISIESVTKVYPTGSKPSTDWTYR